MKFIFIFISLLLINNALSKPCIRFRCPPGEVFTCPKRKIDFRTSLIIRLEPPRVCPECKCVKKKDYED